MSARSDRVTTLLLIRAAAALSDPMRRTARTVMATATTARTATAAPIFTPIGRSANQPPERPGEAAVAGTDMLGSWVREDACGWRALSADGFRRRDAWWNARVFRTAPWRLSGACRGPCTRKVGDRIPGVPLSTGERGGGPFSGRPGTGNGARTSVQGAGQRLEEDDDRGRVGDAVPRRGLALAHLDGEVAGGEDAEGEIGRASSRERV